MKTSIIILDGAKGAGKSTTSKELEKLLSETAFLSMDQMRGAITKSEPNDKYNNIAFDALMSVSESYLKNGVSIVLDSGMKKARISILRNLAKKTGSSVYFYNLYAPKETLWNRVLGRAEEKGKAKPDRERFDYVYETLQDKDFSDHVTIDTTLSDPRECTKQIYEEVI